MAKIIQLSYHMLPCTIKDTPDKYFTCVLFTFSAFSILSFIIFKFSSKALSTVKKYKSSFRILAIDVILKVSSDIHGRMKEILVRSRKVFFCMFPITCSSWPPGVSKFELRDGDEGMYAAAVSDKAGRPEADWLAGRQSGYFETWLTE